jgi:hypothetical protein
MSNDLAKSVVLWVLVGGVLIYAVILGLYIMGSAFGCLKDLVKFFNTAAPAFVFHLPLSAAAAFGIVLVFDAISPFAKDASSLSFEAFGAKFSGPAAPATIWVVCYLSFVASLRIVAPKT